MLGLDLPKVEQERFKKWSAIYRVRKQVKWLNQIETQLTANHGSVCWPHGLYIIEHEISCMQVCYWLRSNECSQFIVLMNRCLYNWLDIRISWVHYCGMVSGKSLKCKKRE